MAVAFPVGIGLALVIGVMVNYIANPVGNLALLFGGVVLIVIAILLNAGAYRKMQSAGKQTSAKALLLAVIAGVLMGFFYKSMSQQTCSAISMCPEACKLKPVHRSCYFLAAVFC